MELKGKSIDIYNFMPYFYYTNFININNLKIVKKYEEKKEENKNNNKDINNNCYKDNIYCNFDYVGNLWFLYGDKLRKY